MRLEFIFVHVNEVIDNQEKRLTAVRCNLHAELRQLAGGSRVERLHLYSSAFT
jgi:hypothetical protein